jgi:hypothetical protein
MRAKLAGVNCEGFQSKPGSSICTREFAITVHLRYNQGEEGKNTRTCFFTGFFSLFDAVVSAAAITGTAANPAARDRFIAVPVTDVDSTDPAEPALIVRFLSGTDASRPR